MSNICMRFKDGKAKALTLSYDDGVEQDIRLIEIMNQNGLRGTFNLNSGIYPPLGTVIPKGQIHRKMTKEQATKIYTDSCHEVAVHGLTHPFLEQLPMPLAMWELIEDRRNLEEQFHTIIRGMAYPYGTYNDAVIDCLKKSGLVYARTVISSHNFKIPTDWLRLEPTCHHNDVQLMPLIQEFVEESPKWEPWLFYLWGHSYEFERDNNWHVIEQFASFTGDKKDIWYATNIQIYDYVDAYKRLQFSIDQSQVYNPTAVILFFQKDTTVYCIHPGEKINI